MIDAVLRRMSVLLMTLCIVALPVAQSAHAAIITTDKVIELSDRAQQIARVNAMMARESVQSALVQYGVDPVDARTRVESLTAAELQVLEANLAKLPAGGIGVVEIVGVVAIVLIVLELLHVTNLFTRF